MSDFIKGYTEAILNGEHEDKLRPEALDAIMDDCLRFSTEHKQFLLDNYLCKFQQAGEDFWAARNEEKNLLTQFCADYPPVQVFKHVTGSIHL